MCTEVWTLSTGLVCKFHAMKKEAIMLDCENGNAHLQDTFMTEMDQLFECSIFKDLGKMQLHQKDVS